jgi:tellurium resistance protein TerD
MAKISLRKGQRVALGKAMTMARVALGWDTNRYDGGKDFDLDASCFLVGENGKVGRDEDFIFYNNLRGRNGAVVHSGDNLTGGSEGDDEVILVDFKKMPADVRKIVFCVTIHEADERRQNFGQVSNAYVRVDSIEREDDAGTEALQFDLMEEFSVETALVVCEIYRYNDEWKFNAVGAGYAGGLEALCRSYGLDASYS